MLTAPLWVNTGWVKSLDLHPDPAVEVAFQAPHLVVLEKTEWEEGSPSTSSINEFYPTLQVSMDSGLLPPRCTNKLSPPLHASVASITTAQR